MRTKEIEQSLKMFSKFLSSDEGKKVAHIFSDDIEFRLGPRQHLNPESIEKKKGNYWIMVDIIYNKSSQVMINWKNVPNHQDMRKELRQWLPFFGFSNNVDIMIVHTKKEDDFPL